MSREQEGQREVITIWGLGFHEQREHWRTDRWEWYHTAISPKALKQQLTKTEVNELPQERRSDIAPYAVNPPQSRRARLFESLADMTDDDAALIEIEDLGADWFEDP